MRITRSRSARLSQSDGNAREDDSLDAAKGTSSLRAIGQVDGNGGPESDATTSVAHGGSAAAVESMFGMQGHRSAKMIMRGNISLEEIQGGRGESRE